MYIEDFIHPLVSLCRPPKSRRNEEREMLGLKELRFEKNAKIFFAFFWDIRTCDFILSFHLFSFVSFDHVIFK